MWSDSICCCAGICFCFCGRMCRSDRHSYFECPAAVAAEAGPKLSGTERPSKCASECSHMGCSHGHQQQRPLPDSQRPRYGKSVMSISRTTDTTGYCIDCPVSVVVRSHFTSSTLHTCTSNIRVCCMSYSSPRRHRNFSKHGSQSTSSSSASR